MNATETPVAQCESVTSRATSQTWPQVKLGDVIESMKNGIYRPASAYADDGVPSLRMYNVNAGQIVWRDIRRMRLTKQEVRDYELRPGDLLVNRVNSRELVGKAAVIPDGLGPLVFESKNIRVRLRRDRVMPSFVSYQLLAAGTQYFTNNAQQVVGMASISQSQVAGFPLVLPPIEQQSAIVSEIEKQFTRVDAGVAALRRAQANLKRYRAAVLTAACEGRLVPTEADLAQKEGRSYETGEKLLARILTERRQSAKGRGGHREPAGPNAQSLTNVREGWTWATVEQLNLAHRPCAYGVLQPGDHVQGGVALVRVGDIRDGKVSTQALKRISPKIAAQYPRTTLRGGELAITLVGAIGRAAVIPAELRGGNTARAVGIVPLTTRLDPHWVSSWFRRPATIAALVSKSHEVARKTLNLEDVRTAIVALPPVAEQHRIVAEIERRLSVVEELEALVSANLQRAGRLRQAILQRAFEGRLVTVTPTE